VQREARGADDARCETRTGAQHEVGPRVRHEAQGCTARGGSVPMEVSKFFFKWRRHEGSCTSQTWSVGPAKTSVGPNIHSVESIIVKKCGIK